MSIVGIACVTEPRGSHARCLAAELDGTLAAELQAVLNFSGDVVNIFLCGMVMRSWRKQEITAEQAELRAYLRPCREPHAQAVFTRKEKTFFRIAGPQLTERTVPLELIVSRFRITIMLMIVGVLPAAARDNGQWGNSPAHIRQWFQSLMQPDNPAQSCCGEGDAFEADNWEIEQDGTFIAIITDGKGTVPNGTRVVVPDRKLKWDAGNPTGHGIIFLTSSFQAICYVTPGGV